MAPPYTAETTAEELVNDYADTIKGKVVLTTGVSPGSIGSTFVESIAKAQPSLLILAGRNLSKLRETADAITAADTNSSVQVRLLELELSSLASVRRAAATVKDWDDVAHIDVLVNNAGVMGIDWALSPEGYEKTLATNHLGPFLLTNLIMDKLLESKSPRIVNISSEGHRFNPIRWGDWNFQDGKTYNKWHAYGQSKTATMLTAIALAEKLGPKRGLLAFSVHPGLVFSHLADHFSWEGEQEAIKAVDTMVGNVMEPISFKSHEQGAATHVFAAFAPNLEGHNGAYLSNSQVANPRIDTVKPWATSSIEAERFWELSEKLVGQKFDY